MADMPADAAAQPQGNLWPVLGLLGGACLVGALALGRNYLTFDVETDYVGGFVVTAQEFLNGEPAQLGFHGPLYPAVLALVHGVLRDWVRDGLAVSWLSSIVVAALSFRLLDTLFGRAAAWGSLLALFTSRPFLTLSSSASSDVFFLALTSAALLVAARAAERPRALLWVLLGGVIACALLTRTNGLAYLPLLLTPACAAPGSPSRIRAAGLMLCGLLLPLGVWMAFALYSGATPMPQDLQSNLASTYFAADGDRVSGDTIDALRGRFAGTWDVIASDPFRVAGIYARDAVELVRADFGSDAILAFPLFMLALPGLVLLIQRVRAPFTFLFLLVLAGQTAFVNLRVYDPRFNLFLVPFLGACAGICAASLLKVSTPRLLRAAIVVGFSALLAVGARSSIVDSYAALHAQDAELGDSVPRLRGQLDGSALLVARKAHLGFYTGSRTLLFPRAESFDELERALAGAAAETPVYLYYGGAERQYRPTLSALGAEQGVPPWLRPVARSETPGLWTLYRVEAK